MVRIVHKYLGKYQDSGGGGLHPAYQPLAPQEEGVSVGFCNSTKLQTGICSIKFINVWGTVELKIDDCELWHFMISILP